jgi:hypothetical protein
VLVSQAEPMIEVFYKQDEKSWLYSSTKGLDQAVAFQTLQCELALKDIYQKIEWKEKAEEQLAVGSK